MDQLARGALRPVVTIIERVSLRDSDDMRMRPLD